MPDSSTSRYVISVLLPDRVAILRDITSAIVDAGGNIDAISQTVLAGHFSLTLAVTVPARMQPQSVRAAIICRFPDDPISVAVVQRVAETTGPSAVDGARYIITAAGPDRPGILKAVTAMLADRGINIEDWQVGIVNGWVTHVGEVTVPAALDILKLQQDFRDILASVGLNGGLQHENIFRATSEIGPIRSLTGGPRS
jgi:glycine cleavage system transcriptional repressor